jgi:hypothetical protein
MTSDQESHVSNSNGPFGFRQCAGLGSSPTYEQYENGNGGIDYNTAAIYFQDPVTRIGSGDGTIEQGANGQTTPFAGVFIGCKYLSTSQKRTVWSNYWPGSDVTSANQSSISAWVVNDPNAQFVAQTDSTGFVQADVGTNVDYQIGTGTTSNGFSGAYLVHGGATTSTKPWRFQSLILDPPGAPGTATGAYNWVVVGFNNVETKALTAGNT